MDKPTGKKKFPVFYIVLFSLVVLFFCALGFFLAYLNDMLGEYEKMQPKYLAEDIFNGYYKAEATDKLIDTAVCIPENISGKKKEKYFSTLLSESNITYVQVSGDTENNELKYAVSADGKKFSCFTIEKTEEKSDHSFDRYKLKKIELYFNQSTVTTHLITIKAPSDLTVYADGKAISGKNIIETGIETDSCKYMPDGTQGLTYNIYKVSDLATEMPDITALSADGTKETVSYSKKEKMYVADVIYSEKLKNKFSSFVTDACKTYAQFVWNDTELSQCLKYFKSGTDLYTNIKNTNVEYVPEHNGSSFSSVKCEEFFGYSDSVFSCKVSFVQNIHKNGKDDYPEHFSVTLYLEKGKSGWLIYKMINN